MIDRRVIIDAILTYKVEHSQQSPPDGHQWHIDHDGCPAGTDRKQRLYIKRKGRSYLAYCHHCSDHGYHIGSHASAGALVKGLHSGYALPVTKFPKDLAAELPALESTFPIKVHQEYFFRYTKHLDVAKEWDCGWDPVGQRIWYKVRDNKGRLVRLLARDPFRVAKTKVLSYKEDGVLGGHLKARSHVTPHDVVFVVEDWVSALLVSDYGANAYCLFGCTFIQEDILRLLEFKRVVILLDNDKAGIEASDEIKERLALFHPGTISNRSRALPEKCSPKDTVFSARNTTHEIIMQEHDAFVLERRATPHA